MPLPRLLYWSTLGVALFFILVVVVAPVVDTGDEEGHPVVTLFARDAALRRTALASAVGLVVTASVFFQVPPTPARRTTPRAKRPPPDNLIGA